MALKEKFEEFAKTAYDKTGEAVEYTKLNARILSEKNTIKDEYKKLGEYMYQAYKEGAVMDERSLEFCHSIDAHKDSIQRTKEELNNLKSDASTASETNHTSKSDTGSKSQTVIVSQVVSTSKDEVEMTVQEC